MGTDCSTVLDYCNKRLLVCSCLSLDYSKVVLSLYLSMPA